MNVVNATNTLNYPSRESALARYLVTAFSWVLIFGSLVGNSLVITAVKKNIGGNMNTRSNYFILNLSVADLAMSAQSFMTLSVRLALNDSFLGMDWSIEGILGRITCKVYKFTIQALSLVSICWILVISVDRACAILFPLKILITKRVARILWVFAWIMPCAYASHAFYFFDTDEVQGTCTLLSDDESLAQYRACYSISAVILLLTFLALTILYTAVIVKLWFRKIPGEQNTATQQRRKKMNRRVLAMLVILVLTFYICHFPIWLYTISFMFVQFSDLNTTLTSNSLYILVAACLMLSYGSINPYIIIMFIQNFRTAIGILIRNIFPCLKCTRPAHISQDLDVRRNFGATKNPASTHVAGIQNKSIQLNSYCVSKFLNQP